MDAHGCNVGHQIGQGNYGTVIIAHNNENDNRPARLACKILDKAKEESKIVKKFFPRELEILPKLQHPNIIQIESICEHGTKILIFMRYAEKGDLASHLDKSGPIDEMQSKFWFYQMANALDYLHDHEIAHRDLKCDNILITRHRNVKLADFGYARYCRDKSGKKVQSQTYCGTMCYSAPEILTHTPYDPKLADAWSLGVVLFTMMNNRMPFDTSNVMRMLKQQLAKKFGFRSSLKDSISASAKAMVSVLLEPDVQERWNLREVLNSQWFNSLKKPHPPTSTWDFIFGILVSYIIGLHLLLVQIQYNI